MYVKKTFEEALKNEKTFTIFNYYNKIENKIAKVYQNKIVQKLRQIKAFWGVVHMGGSALFPSQQYQVINTHENRSDTVVFCCLDIFLV